MALLELTPLLRTRDLPGSIRFYVETLGFRLEAHDEAAAWASLHLDGVAIMLAGPNEHLPSEQPRFTGSLYFRTDEVDACWNRVREKAAVCYPLESFEYGMREFGIFDNNGYLLQFGQEINSGLPGL
jgi:uncharacterized glyoxalase superfamily protein PhnB